MMRRIPLIRDQFKVNGNYKLVSFFVAFILWFIIISNKNIEHMQKISVNYYLNPSSSYKINNDVEREVMVKVIGSRSAIKRFSEVEQVVNVDLEGLKPGWRKVYISNKTLNLPEGIKVLSIQPNVVNVNIEESAKKE